MNHRSLRWTAIFALALAACGRGKVDRELVIGAGQEEDSLIRPGEVHLRHLRQLTFGGENAEGYFSFDGTRLIFQSRPPGAGCDQIYVMDLATGDTSMVSTGEGRTTCSYFYPSGTEILYSSTHLADPACPPTPDYSMGYVWPVYPTYDIFASNLDGSDLHQLTDTPGYDAEATFSPLGNRIVFTSDRDGDLDLYTMAPDGSDVKRLTDTEGYDGGAFYSPDGSQIVWRAHYPKPGPELEDYRKLLSQGLIRPGQLDIMLMNADGSDQRQVTHLPGASFAPFWHPSGTKVIFSSNTRDPQGRDFDLYMVALDGTGLERITFDDGFDGFPVFSPDGKYLVFASNRNNGGSNDTNLFIAEWVENPGK